jgi:hypothetical protein
MRLGNRYVGLGRYRWWRYHIGGSRLTALHYAFGWEPKFRWTDGVNPPK